MSFSTQAYQIINLLFIGINLLPEYDRSGFPNELRVLLRPAGHPEQTILSYQMAKNQFTRLEKAILDVHFRLL